MTPHLECAGGAEWVRAAALLHDLGNYSDAFQARLRVNSDQVDHQGAGARLAAETYGPAGTLLLHATAGHHGGMPDGAGD